MQRDFAYGADQHRDHTASTHISRRFTYFGTRSTRLRALIGLDLLIVVHLYRVSEARICRGCLGERRTGMNEATLSALWKGNQKLGDNTIMRIVQK